MYLKLFKYNSSMSLLVSNIVTQSKLNLQNHMNLKFLVFLGKIYKHLRILLFLMVHLFLAITFSGSKPLFFHWFIKDKTNLGDIFLISIFSALHIFFINLNWSSVIYNCKS